MSIHNTDREAQLAVESVNELTRATDASNADRRAASLQDRIDDARIQLNDARVSRNQRATELETHERALELAQQRLRNLQNEQRTHENMVRIFGTREDMDAAGDAYESPIGGMFNRAWERFRAAEETRSEERTVRERLASEQAIGGEEQMLGLAELQAAASDVWSVPQSQSDEIVPSQGIRHAGTSNTTQLMEMARDEVFAGQDLEAQQHEPVATVVRRLADDMEDTTALDFVAGRVPTGLAATDEEAALLQAGRAVSRDSSYDPMSIHNRYLDLRHLLEGLRSIDESEGRDSRVAYQPILLMSIQEALDGCADESNFDETYQAMLERLLADNELCWSLGLSSARLTRSIAAGRVPQLSANLPSVDDFKAMEDLELIGQAFMTSVRVRQASGLSFDECQFLMRRLQAHDRGWAMRRRLTDLLTTNPEVVDVARQVLRETFEPGSSGVHAIIEHMNRSRIDAARRANASRAELERRRGTLRALSSRGGEGLNRIAMDALSRADSMQQGTGTRPDSLGRMMQMHLDWESEARLAAGAEHEEDESAGLDATNSGRPEPKSEEELTIKSECRICFDQIADVACLPCGHLVMCRWCSDQHSPCTSHDRTRPRRPAACPVCRKRIKQKVIVYRA